jgi:hypothetical protein
MNQIVSVNRDMIAVAAMQGILSSLENWDDDFADKVAEISVQCADALIKKLSESETSENNNQ